MRRTTFRPSGFTLIELVTAVAVVGILAAIAYPSYLQYVIRANRGDATRTIMYTAHQLERCYSDQFSYLNCPNVQYSQWFQTNNGYYWVWISAFAGPNGYNIWAVPNGVPQANDAVCGQYFLSSNSFQWVSGTGTVQDCFGSS